MTPESRDGLNGMVRVLRHSLTMEKQEIHLDLQQNLMRAPL